MNKLLAPLALALAALLTTPGYSQTPNGTATADFNVSVTLTAKCRIGTPPGTITLTYESFQGAESSNTTPYTVECTNTLPYSMSLSSTSATLAGLPVTLSVRNSGNTADVTGTQTAGTSAASYRIRAAIPAGEQGTCALGTCTDSAQRTLTITY